MANLNILLPILRVLLQILQVVVSSLENSDQKKLSDVSNILASCDLGSIDCGRSSDFV